MQPEVESIDPQKDQVERICISVNTRCNYACRYCYFFNPENHVDAGESLSVEEIGVILEQAYEYHVQYGFSKRIKVNFVGSGEPLLNWREIVDAVARFRSLHPDQDVIKFYTVTNASLLTPGIADEMKALRIMPSVSLDGPRELHDAHRLLLNGQGTFDATMRGIDVLRAAGFDVAINTTLTREVYDHLDAYFDFVQKQGFQKVIFDRLVDAPQGIDVLSVKEFYQFLTIARNYLTERGMTTVEVGNLEAFERNFAGTPDQVCTMFGGSCGAGSHFLIYMGTDVYPCGRMFGDPAWLLGTSNEPIDLLQSRMAGKRPLRSECSGCEVSAECVQDCLLDSSAPDYSCESRNEFLTILKAVRGELSV